MLWEILKNHNLRKAIVYLSHRSGVTMIEMTFITPIFSSNPNPDPTLNPNSNPKSDSDQK